MSDTPTPKRYRRRPTEIEAIQFDPKDPPNFVVVCDETGYESGVYNVLHQSYIKLKPGDFIRINDPDDMYPIDRATFLQTYQEIE